MYPNKDYEPESITFVKRFEAFLRELKARIQRSFPETFVVVGNLGLDGSLGRPYVSVQGEFASRVRQLFSGEEIDVSELTQTQYDLLVGKGENSVAEAV